jgi:hypothetical protein
MLRPLRPTGAAGERYMCLQHVVGQLSLQLPISARTAPTVPGLESHVGRLAGRQHAGEHSSSH